MDLRRPSSWLPAVLLVAGGVACEGPEPTTGPAQYLSSVSPACETCLVDLVECTSTSKDEIDFIQCRDLFQGCQTERDLGAGECANPTDEDACVLCERRSKSCEGESCAAQYGVCVALLASRAGVCGAAPAPPPEKQGCAVCLDGLASCASTAGADPVVCHGAFGECLTGMELPVEACPVPEGDRACDLCDAHQKLCELSAGPTCADDFVACKATLTGGDCSDGGGTGGGGAGGGSPVCAHHECAPGEKLDATCSECAAEVCALDPFCCDTDYDDLCVAKAATVASCGCEAACVHSECVEGEKLNPNCSVCAGLVCAADDFCCANEYDTYCVDQAAQTPECGCF